ncbi:MAG: LytTR family DNA-binding domain-containing protein [Crocinitomicaceae bacterium]|nr:LytTR family DNA-binding domain-containing protein [Crocinitomicaceae bacterium]
MTRKVLIIDDEKPTREFIRKMLESFDLKLEIYTDGESVQSGIEAIENLKPDIVLLDIQMPDGNGFDVLKAVSNKSFEIIFITAYQEFAVQAIKFSALDYILKPIDAEELKNAVSNALQLLSHKKDDQQIQALQNNIQPHLKRKLVLKTQESIFVVEIDEIVHCEADKNYTFFYLNDGKKILVSKTLKDYDTLLAGLQFFRVHQSHLINLNCVERYDKHDGGSVILKDGTAIPLSPAKKEQFFKSLDQL